MKKILFCLLSWIAVNTTAAQYAVLGDATKIDCHCYTLTPDTINQSGSIWNQQKINLNFSFDYQFSIFLGCKDVPGADGIAFVLQPAINHSDSIGMSLGYNGLSPAVAVTIDTWQNGNPTTSAFHGDPSFDHIAIQLNGDLDHRDSVAPLPINNIAGPVRALQGNDNIEDCKWHILRVQWDAVTKTLTAYIDGVQRLSVSKDFVNDLFGNDPMVVWGFTGSTGDNTNIQQVCTALKPSFSFANGQNKCANDKIFFYDNTISFAPVTKMYWDFGDGSPIDSISVNPEHSYVLPGNYTVLQTVIGADGCLESYSQQLIIGSKPVADFEFNDACVLDSTVTFINTSSAAFGTINKWFWNFGDGGASNQQSPTRKYVTPGLKQVRLVVTSVEGCRSDTVIHTVRIYEKPVADLDFSSSLCVGAPTRFNGLSSVKDGSITNWHWQSLAPDTVLPDMQAPSLVYNSAGQYSVALTTTSSNGCVSKEVSKTFDITTGPVAAFKFSPVCQSMPVFFKDASVNNAADPVTAWWWDLGYEITSTLKDPENSYEAVGEYMVKLVAKTALGCISDTVRQVIKVDPAPLARFGNQQPVCANVPLRFYDSSTAVPGSVQSWYWKFANGTTSTLQNPTVVLPAGNQTVQLLIKDNLGCQSDSVIKTIYVSPQPVIDFIPANACMNSLVTFTGIDRSGAGISAWQWKFHDGTVTSTSTTQKFYGSSGLFPVQLSAISPGGCPSAIVSKDIIIYSANAFAGNDTAIIINQPFQLNGTGGASYEWTPATGLNNPRVSNPVTILSQDIRYILKVVTPMGCIGYDSINIRVFLAPEIFVPKAFTPNGDGLNDILKAIPVAIREFKHFTVYSRYGELIFTTPVPSKGWDGTYRGKRQNNGGFVWIAAGIGYNGQFIMRKGSVVLIR